jgi:hypothetical protein
LQKTTDEQSTKIINAVRAAGGMENNAMHCSIFRPQRVGITRDPASVFFFALSAFFCG